MLESRLGADIYQDKAMIDEYLYGSGDIHSLVAKACFPEELEGIDVKDIKKLRPDLRKKAKGPEFACQFGGGYMAISQTLGISQDEAKVIEENYYKMFKGISSFKPFLINLSVLVSTALVESSKISILGFFKSARAIQSLCF
mgnify:CR=1 FL=1